MKSRDCFASGTAGAGRYGSEKPSVHNVSVRRVFFLDKSTQAVVQLGP